MANISFTSPYLPNVTLQSTDSWLLVKRTCPAATLDRVNDVNRLGYDAWLDQQLNPTQIDDTEYENERKRIFPSYGVMTEAQFTTKYPGYHAMVRGEHLQQAEFHASWRSKRQLQQMMITFWSDQISYDMKVSKETTHDMAKAYKDHALGKFKDLLIATYSNRIIVDFLDNWVNTKYGLNENLGRELLELHTVGRDAGYTQQDVINSAIILTGWKGGTYRNYEHQTGAVKILGFSHANSTTDATACKTMLYSYLTYLAKHPATARRIADRLVERFVSDTPKTALASRLASIYLANDTDIRPVLKALFTSTEFKASGGQKVRRPQEILATLVAAGGIKPKSTVVTNPAEGTTAAMAKLDDYRDPLWEGNCLPHWWNAPDGYPLASKKWLSSAYMKTVWGFQRYTPGNTTDTTAAAWASRLGVTVGTTTVVAAVQNAASRMYGFTVTKDSALEKSLRTYVGNNPSSTTQNLPSATLKMDSYMLDRLPKAVLMSPLSNIA